MSDDAAPTSLHVRIEREYIFDANAMKVKDVRASKTAFRIGMLFENLAVSLGAEYKHQHALRLVV